jgi:hypothetical protein
LPILFVSAYDDEHTTEAVRSPRIEGFVRKGRPVEDILAWVEYLIAPDEEKLSKLPKGRSGGNRLR